MAGQIFWIKMSVKHPHLEDVLRICDNLKSIFPLRIFLCEHTEGAKIYTEIIIIEQRKLSPTFGIAMLPVQKTVRTTQ